MTTSPSEIRKQVVYSDLSYVQVSPVEPDTINFEIMKNDEILLAEWKCTVEGKRSLYFWNQESDKWSRHSTEPDDIDFKACSEGFREKVHELKKELDDWEANCRKPLGVWDPRLLANPPLDYDELVKMEEG